MTIPAAVASHHAQQARRATAIYTDSLTDDRSAQDWYRANIVARKKIIQALRATDYFADLAKGIARNASHIKVLRHILAPPMSQDQFSLLCSAYSKSAENSGARVSENAASTIGTLVAKSRDRRLARWLDREARPTAFQVKELLHSVAPLLSQQLVTTMRRTRLSADQEAAVIELLLGKGWVRHHSALVKQSSDVPARGFMHKTKFATKTRPQEVDIACGFGNSIVLAMECKVTNDETNSVKRVNDVLKKAAAWQDHWGSFVRTAALLQGVVSAKDVNRLLAADVSVFWSHDLEAFGAWIDKSVI